MSDTPRISLDRQVLQKIRPKCGVEECDDRPMAFEEARSFRLQNDNAEVVIATFRCRRPATQEHRAFVALPDGVQAKRIGEGKGRGGIYEFVRSGQVLRTKPQANELREISETRRIAGLAGLRSRFPNSKCLANAITLPSQTHGYQIKNRSDQNKYSPGSREWVKKEQQIAAESDIKSMVSNLSNGKKMPS